MIVVPGRIFDNIIGIYIIIVVPGSIFASIMGINVFLNLSGTGTRKHSPVSRQIDFISEIQKFSINQKTK